MTLAASAAVGVAVGAAAGFGLAALLRFHLVPDRLHNPVALAAAIACFVAANRLSVEAGLFATTVMGIVLVNQRLAPVAHIAAFGEDLGVLILGALFVVLGSAVDLSALQSVLAPSALLLVVLLATRPMAVWAATIGARLRGNERWYLSLMAPRGVVAASVAALFSVSLRRQGVDGAEILAPAAFCVIVGTVLFASLVARPASRWFRVADAEPRGVLLAGDQWWLRDAGAALAASGVPVLVVATADEVADEAVANGLLSYAGPLDDDELAEAMHGVGVGEAVVAAGGDGVASFLVDRLSDLLGRRHVYRVAPAERRRRASRSWGRQAFPELADPDAAVDPERWRITTVPALHLVGDSADVVPLFLLREDAEPVVLAGRRAGGLDGPAVVAERCAGEDGPAAPG
ncbi:MAG: cation:proton antiporter [Acidimicrobiales bacterium]